MNQLTLSIVIPAFNEAGRLPIYLPTVVHHLNALSISYEIIVVDDGSTDATVTVVEKLMSDNNCIKLIRLPANRGKGFAVKTGMLAADGTLRLFADADGATPITEYGRLKQAIDEGADIAIASRALKGDSSVVRAHLHRKVMGRIFSGLVNLIAVRGVSDTQCGFKLFTARCAETVFSLQRLEDFGFDVEILFIGKKHGFRIAEVPVNWADVRGSKVKLMRDSFKMFCDVFAIKKEDLLGAYQKHSMPMSKLESGIETAVDNPDMRL